MTEGHSLVLDDSLNVIPGAVMSSVVERQTGWSVYRSGTLPHIDIDSFHRRMARLCRIAPTDPESDKSDHLLFSTMSCLVAEGKYTVEVRPIRTDFLWIIVMKPNDSPREAQNAMLAAWVDPIIEELERTALIGPGKGEKGA